MKLKDHTVFRHIPCAEADGGTGAYRIFFLCGAICLIAMLMFALIIDKDYRSNVKHGSGELSVYAVSYCRNNGYSGIYNTFFGRADTRFVCQRYGG